MERIPTPETRVYMDGDFIIEISFDGDLYECWLSATNCGTKEYMFGLPRVQPEGCADYDWDLVEEVVEANLDEYEEEFRENHCF